MTIIEFQKNMQRNKRKLNQYMPASITSCYTNDELDVMAFVFNISKCMETSLKVANSYKGSKIATRQGKCTAWPGECARARGKS